MRRGAMEVFSPFSNDTWTVLGILTYALEKKRSVALVCGRHGMRLVISRVTVATGKTPQKLVESYDNFLEKNREKFRRIEARISAQKAKGSTA